MVDNNQPEPQNIHDALRLEAWRAQEAMKRMMEQDEIVIIGERGPNLDKAEEVLSEFSGWFVHTDGDVYVQYRSKETGTPLIYERGGNYNIDQFFIERFSSARCQMAVDGFDEPVTLEVRLSVFGKTDRHSTYTGPNEVLSMFIDGEQIPLEMMADGYKLVTIPSASQKDPVVGELLDRFFEAASDSSIVVDPNIEKFEF